LLGKSNNKGNSILGKAFLVRKVMLQVRVSKGAVEEGRVSL